MHPLVSLVAERSENQKAKRQWRPEQLLQFVALLDFSKTGDLDKPAIDRVNEIARERNLPPSQISLAWLLYKPVITAPIVGATKPHHLEDAVAAINVKLSDQEIARLEEPYQPHPPSEAFS